jgi:hypothetical protein
MPTHLNPQDIEPVKVGPGCYRRDLPTLGDVRAWFVDIEAGARWPFMDQHGQFGESVFVISGEMIEGEERYGPGAYLLFGADSRHQPRSETGVRLFGFNPL